MSPLFSHFTPRFPGRLPHQPSRQRAYVGGFTLVELLAVIAVMVVMIGLLAPALTSLKGAGDVTKASYDISGVLELARTYAMANSTYTWVGFFEEDSSKRSLPATAGNGRVVISVVASRDGTNIYDFQLTSSLLSGSALLQISKPLKVDNMHLAAFGPSGSYRNAFLGSFGKRPSVDTDNAKVGEISQPGGFPADAQYPFLYPLNAASAGAAQYVFKKIIQFTPRGEAMVPSTANSSDKYTLNHLIEVGLCPSHGSLVDANSPNLAAIQIAGIPGTIKIYRP